MKCADIKMLFIDILEDSSSIDEKTKTVFFDHLKECGVCANEFEKLEELNNKLIQVKSIKSDEVFVNDFSIRLEEEKDKAKKMPSVKSFYQFSYKVAAGILLFIIGSLFGYYFTMNSKVSKLEEEVCGLKYSYTSTILKEQTITAKIKAIGYFNGEPRIDEDFLKILQNLLNKDDNVNVRLAAAKALFKYSNQEEVKTILIESLGKQTEPKVQIELINYLVQNNEKQAIELLQMIISNNEANNIVRQYANNGLKVLL
ncbi:HEAT repeat domain-containing protein [Bacteroidota bacterium]